MRRDDGFGHCDKFSRGSGSVTLQATKDCWGVMWGGGGGGIWPNCCTIWYFCIHFNWGVWGADSPTPLVFQNLIHLVSFPHLTPPILLHRLMHQSLLYQLINLILLPWLTHMILLHGLIHPIVNLYNSGVDSPGTSDSTNWDVVCHTSSFHSGWLSAVRGHH